METSRLFLFTLLVLLALVTAASAFSSSLRAASTSPVLITGVLFDPAAGDDAAEAVRLENTSAERASLDGWTLTDGEGRVYLPAIELAPGARVWLSRSAAAFAGEFGFKPDYEYGPDSDATVPNLAGTVLSLANSGDELLLADALGATADAVPYEAGNAQLPGWYGPAVRRYSIGNRGVEGQILARKRLPETNSTVPDTDSAADWLQDPNDPQAGQRVEYPGWDNEAFAQPVRAVEAASIRYCIGPDHLFDCVRREIVSATKSISIEVYALENPALVDALTERIENGVQVSVLLDGAALTDPGKWACQQIEQPRGERGLHGECWLMAARPQANVARRYDNLHGKWLIVDHARLLVGSENLTADGMPFDKMADGTRGARGAYFITDSPTLVAAAQAVLDRDLEPQHHADIRRWGTRTDDFPPLHYTPDYSSGGKGYAVQFPKPFNESGTFAFELTSCPENCLRPDAALLGLATQAGAGDTLLMEQLYEYPYWGGTGGGPVLTPNLRLAAYLDAARRGARVRLLLDSFYDVASQARSNAETCAWINGYSAVYDVECRLANPTGLGIHNKLVLLKQAGGSSVLLGSVNGSETSNKLNRELAVQVESEAAYKYWAQVFAFDWARGRTAPYQQWLPLLGRAHAP